MLKPSTYKYLAVVASIMLIIALSELPYGYYMVLRFVVCGVSALGILHYLGTDNRGVAFILFIVAIVFNPLQPIHFERSTWVMIDLFAAGILLLSIFGIPKEENEQDDS